MTQINLISYNATTEEEKHVENVGTQTELFSEAFGDEFSII